MFGQIRFAGNTAQPNELAIHHVKEDGSPGCGDKVRPWKNKAATFVFPVDPTKCPQSKGMCKRNGCFPDS